MALHIYIYIYIYTIQYTNGWTISTAGKQSRFRQYISIISKILCKQYDVVSQLLVCYLHPPMTFTVFRFTLFLILPIQINYMALQRDDYDDNETNANNRFFGGSFFFFGFVSSLLLLKHIFCGKIQIIFLRRVRECTYKSRQKKINTRVR